MRHGRQPYMIDAGALHAGARADVHVLVVGDPGMGKSQMLTAAVCYTRLEPRTSMQHPKQNPGRAGRAQAGRALRTHTCEPRLGTGIPRAARCLCLWQHELFLRPHRHRGQGRDHRPATPRAQPATPYIQPATSCVCVGPHRDRGQGRHHRRLRATLTTALLAAS